MKYLTLTFSKLACIGMCVLSMCCGVPVFASDGLVEPCALESPAEGAYCDDVNDLVAQLIRIGEYLLGITGTLALVMFFYGGLTLLTAMGQAEKAKKAQQIIFAAVIGLVITFSAYILVEFVVKDALQVSEYYRG